MGELLKLLQERMKDKESEHLEFKEAKVQYDFEELTRYCAAIANEGGGKIILGINHKRPRKVVGTTVFSDLERTKAGLIERLHLRIEMDEIFHPDGRVLVFNIPSRPLGMAIQFKGAYWMRGGEDLVPMTPDLLKKIFAETGPDFFAEICQQATMADLDTRAIDNFRRVWLRKSENPALENLSAEQLLTDAELILDGDISYAVLIMFGFRQALGKHLGQAEVIFEYRSSEASIPCQQREGYRLGFFLFMDEIWNNVNLRNEMQNFEDGLFIWDIPTDPAHGKQEGVADNGHFAKDCFPPLFGFTSESGCLGAKLRPANVHAAEGALEFIKPLVECCQGWCKVFWVRADAAFANPEHYEYGEEHRITYFSRLPGLMRLWEPYLNRPVGRPPKSGIQVRIVDLHYQAKSWSRPLRVVAKIEWHRVELFPRLGFVVTHSRLPAGKVVKVDNGRGEVENRSKEGKNTMGWDKTSCQRFEANQARLKMGVPACNLLPRIRQFYVWGEEVKCSMDWLIKRLIKVGARVSSHARRWYVHIASAFPLAHHYRAVPAWGS